MNVSNLVPVRAAVRPALSFAAPDRTRIAAETGTILVNAVLLMLLLAPVARPIVERSSPDIIDVVLIPAKPPRQPEPVRAEVSPPRPLTPPVSRPVRLPGAIAPIEQSLSDGPGEPVLADVTIELPAIGSADPLGPTAPPGGARLEHLSAPPPTYPREALRDGLTGTVVLEVLVDVDGRPLQVTVMRSSGHRVLDAAARRQVESRWRFRPATQDGRPVQAIGVVPVEFQLDR